MVMWSQQQIDVCIRQLLKQTRSSICIPLPVQQMTLKLGYRYHFYQPDSDISDVIATLSQETQRFLINEYCTADQQYVAVTRLLGHLACFGFTTDYSCTFSQLEQPYHADSYEAVLDYFTDALLMPTAIFKQQWQIMQGNIEAIAQFFTVMPTLIQRRQRELALELATN